LPELRDIKKNGSLKTEKLSIIITSSEEPFKGELIGKNKKAGGRKKALLRIEWVRGWWYA
jgi:hypothetical protein